MKYLFDTNVFIEAKNRYYAFDICPGFWQWMDHVCGVDAGSIRNVRDELTPGDDDLSEWAKARKDADWFLKVEDAPTQEAFAEIATAISGKLYTQPAIAHFLSGADPWLIAKARTTGAVVVTHELPSPDSKKKVFIPDVCDTFGVPYLNTFDALRELSVTFHLKP
ncbi:DUF4411 family protein [Devosia sp. A449]